MFSPQVAAATAVVAEKEAAHVQALADAAEAADVFRRTPTAETDSDARVKAQKAANAGDELESAKKALKEAEQADVHLEIQKADLYASHTTFWKEFEPEILHCIDLLDDLCATFERVTEKVGVQNKGSRDGAQLRQQVPDGSNSPSAIGMPLVRAVIGLRLYRRVLETGKRFELGLEPWTTLVTPKFPRGHSAPDADLMARAQKIVGGSQLPVVSFHRDLAEKTPFHQKTSATPQRYEVS